MDSMDMLKALSLHKAVSGNESTMCGYIESIFGEYCDSVETDRFYNVAGFKKGLSGKTKIMVTAHYDEIGFLVSGIDEKGFIKFSTIGGIDSKILLAQEVVIHGKREVFGIIGAKPPHLLKPEEAKKAVKLDDLVIDAGLTAERAKESISIGDTITFAAVPFELQNSKLSSKSLDNRAGVAVLAELLKELKELRHEADVYVVATTQEEVGLRGAEISAYNLSPDLAVVIDGCHGEIPDAPKGEAYPLGKGPAIAIGPNLHRKFTNKAIAVAKDENVPYQIDTEPGDTGTEAWAIQVSRQGIPTVLLSVPVKYMHTTIETVHLKDIKNTARLASKLIKGIQDELEGLLCY